nr:MAG TPA: hypothetical protein [Caudoviricetes sp.]
MDNLNSFISFWRYAPGSVVSCTRSPDTLNNASLSHC